MSDEAPFRRLLVAVDTATHDAARLDPIVALAARLRVELTGVFVEDLDLIRSAALPVVRRVNLVTGAEEEFGLRDLERQLRAMAVAMRSALEAAATRAHVSWSFRTVRGVLAEELRAAVADAESLVVSAAARAPAPAQPVRGGLLLALPRDDRPIERITVAVPSGTPERSAAERLARRLARSLGLPPPAVGDLRAIDLEAAGTLLVAGGRERALAGRLGRLLVQVQSEETS